MYLFLIILLLASIFTQTENLFSLSYRIKRYGIKKTRYDIAPANTKLCKYFCIHLVPIPTITR